MGYKEDLFGEDAYIFANEDGSPYHARYDKSELLELLDHKMNEVISVIQKQEYFSPYSYSALFEVTGDWEDSLQKAIEDGIIQQTTDEEGIHHDIINKNISHSKPTHKRIGNLDVLKFSLHLVGYLPQEKDNRRDIVYPILCVFNKNTNMLEIRFEKVKGYISNLVDGFYIKKINQIKEKIESLLDIELLAINLSPIIKFIKEKLNESEENEVAVSAQAHEFHTGSKAILDSGNNDNMILTHIGNLKEIIKNHDKLFNANTEGKQIRELLEEIILEAEYLSDHPWITLAWKNDVKSKVVKVKFLFNYQGQDFSVLQYYGNNADMEKMTYVTQFIFDNKQKFDNQTR